MEFTRKKLITLWAADYNGGESRTIEVHQFDDKVFHLRDKDKTRPRSMGWFALCPIITKQFQTITVLIFHKQRHRVTIKINDEEIEAGETVQIMDNMSSLTLEFPNKGHRKYTINWENRDRLLEWKQNNTRV